MRRDYFKYLTALLLFGSNGIVASRISLQSYHIVFLRTMLGSGLLLALFCLTGQRWTARDHLRDLLFITISGAAMGASWIFLYEAYARIGVGVSSLLYYCGPVIVMVLSPLLFRERLTAFRLAGFALVVCGVLLVNGRAAGALNVPGLLCGGASAILYALMVIANKKAPGIGGMENACIQLTVSFLTVAVFAFCRTGWFFPVAAGDWGWIAALGLVNTGIGCYFYFSSIGGLPVQTVAVCGYLEPASAVIFAVLLLHEPMSPQQLAGAALIIAGAATGELGSGKLFKK